MLTLLDVSRDFLDDFVVTVLRPLARVHLVDGDNHLLDTEGVGEEGVLAGLTVLGDTGFEFTSTGGDDENGTVGLGSTCCAKARTRVVSDRVGFNACDHTPESRDSVRSRPTKNQPVIMFLMKSR